MISRLAAALELACNAKFFEMLCGLLGWAAEDGANRLHGFGVRMRGPIKGSYGFDDGVFLILGHLPSSYRPLKPLDDPATNLASTVNDEREKGDAERIEPESVFRCEVGRARIHGRAEACADIRVLEAVL